MKYLALAALLSQVNGAAKSPGDPCTTAADCGDPEMCCGVATGGKVTNKDGTASSVIVKNNLAVCNKAPDADGIKKAVDWNGEMIGGGDTPVTINYKFIGATDFTCIDKVPEPPKPVDPPTYPTKAVGAPCTGLEDTCGVTDGSLCCGVGKGTLADDTGKPLAKALSA